MILAPRQPLCVHRARGSLRSAVVCVGIVPPKEHTIPDRQIGPVLQLLRQKVVLVVA